MNLQKYLPVVASILIIIAVAILRERSKVVATIFATMPVNMPLALWVLVNGGNDDSNVIAEYVRNFIIGLVPAFVWLFVVYGALKLGWSLLASIVSGYAVWALLIAGLFWVGILSAPK
jgi:hypothetical protein